MKTIDFIKKYWIAVTLAVIVVLLLLFGVIQKCSAKHTENLINQSELALAIAHVKDSMKTASLQVENAKIDSTRRAEQFKTQTANYTAQIHAKAANKYMALAERKQAELDSLKAINAPCDQQLGKCEETNGVLHLAISQKDSTIQDLGTKATGLTNQLTMCDSQRVNDGLMLQSSKNQITEVTRINESLKKELKGKDNFFTKNAIWIGAVAGAVFTYLVVK